jgi:hypothetical protein
MDGCEECGAGGFFVFLPPVNFPPFLKPLKPGGDEIWTVFSPIDGERRFREREDRLANAFPCRAYAGPAQTFE